ncbi:LysR family transcriptional regulator [Endozoicomonas sp. G2_2]|uniref:LysR family transcriptional regulator n=1 Tax=Gammaproteobacteria TaxID=1236 RepID=UPI000C5028F7|nr:MULTISPECIES: LysR family transcriptional regulator [Gammaproteobacteria]MAS09059.1 LysR family transcriptional regulator [Salinisphaera sp.]MBO9470410.1 LysR family transcriptional regulator [Endozoicomonas sp. G2_2]
MDEPTHETPGSALGHGQRALAARLDWNLIRTYLVVAEELHLSRAAARLFVTQPAVSQAIKRLQGQLGYTLIKRRGPRIALTAAGEEVYRIARSVFVDVSSLEMPARGADEQVVGRVKLLSVSRVHSARYNRFLVDFHRRHPRVELEIEVMRGHDLLLALRQNTASFGIGLCRVPTPQIERRLIIPQRYALFCGQSHRLYAARHIDIDTLLQEDLVTFTGDHLGDTLSPLTLFRENHGFQGRLAASSSNLEEVCRLILCGYGIGFLPEDAFRRETETGLLRKLPPEEGLADVDIHLLWNSERPLRSAEAVFRDELLAAFDAG